MPEQPISQPQLIAQLHALGVQPGGVLLVHCAFSKVKPVEGGPAGLIAALQAALGPAGTLVMPSMSWDDEHPFDPRSTPCIEEMGVVADTFWRQPGVLRSDSPHSFAAAGPRRRASPPAPGRDPSRHRQPGGARLRAGRAGAAARHRPPIRHHHPPGRAAGGGALPPPQVRPRSPGEQIARVDYGENDHCCQNFALVAGWLDAKGLQRRGVVGHAGAPGPLA